jgi:hypothetical protein
MTDGSIEVPWQWSWVPDPGADRAAADQWQAATASTFDHWLASGAQPADPGGPTPAGTAPAGAVSAGVAPAGVAPAGVAPAGAAPAGNAPAGTAPAGTVSAGNALAGELWRRAGDLPAGARLLWGAGFDADGPRWWPVQVVVQRVGHADDDPDYLLDLVGARTVVDGRTPDVTYSSTSFGDCVRVTVRERGPDGLVNALVRAATRIEWPRTAAADLLLTTRIWDMSLLAVIGPGMDGLMRQMAGAIAPDRPAADRPVADRPIDTVETR